MMKSLPSVLVTILTLMLCTSVFGQNTPALKTLSVADFNQRIHASVVQLVDVRTPSEVAGGKIKHAVNYNVNSPDFNQSCLTLDKNKPVYLYCLSGIRSEKAGKQLIDLGFKEVYHLQGGFRAWLAASLPVEK